MNGSSASLKLVSSYGRSFKSNSLIFVLAQLSEVLEMTQNIERILSRRITTIDLAGKRSQEKNLFSQPRDAVFPFGEIKLL